MRGGASRARRLAVWLAALALAVPLGARGETAREGKSKMEKKEFTKPDAAELKSRLTPLQYSVTQEQGTEPAFNNEYWDNEREGIYVDVVSGEPLFSSKDKFDSGTGWPSFTRPIAQESVAERADHKLFVRRVEVLARGSGAHLGHVFNDGPKPTGLRYCMNSAALRFVPVGELEARGYGKFLPLFGRKPGGGKEEGGMKTAGAKAKTGAGKTEGKLAAQHEVATLAGGCFWGMEEILGKIPGVLETAVGYTGGRTEHPTYEQVKRGDTGHAESIEIVFDPAKISYERLLGYFFRMHDPTTRDRQANDVGSQYRSAVFYHSEAQRRVAEAVKAGVDKSGKWKRPLVTEIVPAKPFWKAEDYHQQYLEKNPGGYTCHYLRD